MRVRPVLAVLTLTTFTLGGCFGGPAIEPADDPPTYLGRGDPYPTGDEWPLEGGKALRGPFEMLPIERRFLAAADGADIHVWVLRPDLPDGVKAPVVLWSAPYFGTTMQAGDDPTLWDNSGVGEAVPVALLVEQGYAVAIMNLRGSGLSGGCFTWMGSEDWDDTAMVVEWLGAQEWSNGRVGMMGLSYHGTTPWQAAVRAPPALKTIVTAGQVSFPYTFFHTPQGAALAAGPAFNTLVYGLVGTVPPFEAPDRTATEWAPSVPDRACPETADVLAETYRGAYLDTRSESFWEDRRILRDMPQIQASVFMTMGFRDLFGSGHAQEDDPVWGLLPEALPKRMIVGEWGHMFPNFAEAWTETREPWDDVHLPWLDFWLKGIGQPPGLGTVEYQDDAWTWHESTSWPPAEARLEALYLCGDRLAGAACDGAQGTFQSVPWPDAQPVCADGPGPLEDVRLYMTEPLAEDVLLAGNPMALFEVEADLPGGLVSLYTFEVSGDGSCGDDFRRLGFGAADLRFHEGGYAARDFPTGSPTSVRIDHTNLAESIAAGNRLAVAVGHGPADMFEAVPYAPAVTLHGGSHIVWPVVTGTLGGGAPQAEYPPRPFLP